MTAWRDRIATALDGSQSTLLAHEPMSKHTSLGVGGSVELFVRPRGLPALAALWRLLVEERVPRAIVGGGTNLLVADSGFAGCVVCIDRGLDTIELEASSGRGPALLVAAAGTKCSALAAAARQANLAGLEFVAGIPGNVGGAVAMNAGTRASDVAAVLAWVEVIDGAGVTHRLPAEALSLAYRHASLPADVVVARAAFLLVPDTSEAIEQRLRDDLAYRRNTQPQGRNCGSVFRNPPGQAAGRLIEQVGLKGHRLGNACISTVHANWIENLGGATATDVYGLIAHARTVVRQRTGHVLQPEVRMLGDFAALEDVR